MSPTFVKANKAEAKARIAITGPSGSGKTVTSLLWAATLAEGGKVALIDTERDSAKMYADQFDFDTLSMSPPYHPERLIEAIKAAEENQYAALVIDSGSHFWSGPGGILEIVDQAGARASGNKFAGWQTGTPIQQKMVDAILSYNGHVIVTLRTKTEYALDRNDQGRMSPRKIGLAPIQRDGLEYEFTLVLEVDMDHRTIVGKTRCAILADRVFPAPDAPLAAKEFLSWLKAGDPLLSAEGRAAIDEALNTLTPEQRRSLGAVWANVGLGKVHSLLASQEGTALTLIGEARANALPAPDLELVPE